MVRYPVWLALALLLACGGAGAQSLWNKGEKAKGAPTAMVADRRAMAVGDLLTILIVESSSASQQANTSVSKKAGVDVAPGIGPVLKALPQFGFDGKTSSSAQGSTSRTSTLAARLTAKVVQVNPNGTLVFEGIRSVKANDDVQTMKITGVVRRQDIAPDNTVLSTYVADAKIEVTGKGPIAEKQKPGIVTRVFRFLF